MKTVVLYQIFLKRAFCGVTKLTKIMPKRYFENSLKDYDPGKGKPQIPIEYLKSKATMQLIPMIQEKIEPIERNASDGIYLGTAGIAYMFYHLSQLPSFAEIKHDLLSKALTYIEPALNVSFKTRSRDLPSFILGSAGVFAVAAAIYKAVGDENTSQKFREQYYKIYPICKEMNFLSCGSDELFVGRAGYILGALWLSEHTKSPIPKEDIYTLCNTIVASGRNYAQAHKSPCPLMYSYYGTEYLGAAHGLCSILQVLISVPGYLEFHPQDAKDIQTAVNFLLSLQDSEGNFPCATDEIGMRSELVHWCHGAGGMVFLMAKAYLVWKDVKYLKSCQIMADLVWRKGLLKKGPGICHGVAGNGYVFLLLYRLTGEDKYLHRAMAFAKFMDEPVFKNEARTPDYPFSLYEGIAGTVCFLGDLTSPQLAQFPFFDVF